MSIKYDPAHDLLNSEFLGNVPIDDSMELEGVVIDYAKDNRIVAIEVLDASKRTTREPLDLMNLAVVKSPGAAACVKEVEVRQTARQESRPSTMKVVIKELAQRHKLWKSICFNTLTYGNLKLCNLND